MADRPFVIGLTGSIGMGKSETAKMFAAAGCPVFDADACVHALYDDPAVAAEIEAAFAGAAAHGRVDRARLSAALLDDPSTLARLETIVHPKVSAALDAFLTGSARDATFAVLDIPLLFETGWRGRCRAVVAVSAPPAVQRARVLARPCMTAQKLDRILSRQMPDAEKCRLADFVVTTDKGLEDARAQVARILADLTARVMGGVAKRE